MSDLELRSIPTLTHLIRGRSVLTWRQAHGLAIWAYKTTLVEQLIPKTGPWFSAADYGTFFKRQGLGADVTIHAGMMRDPDVIVFNSRDMLLAEGDERLPYFSTSFWLGKLCFRVEGGAGARVIDAAARDRALDMTEIYPRFGGAALPEISEESFVTAARVQHVLDSGPDAWRLLL